MLPQFNIPRWEVRLYEIIPGFLAWMTFVIPIILTFYTPRVLSIFIILFDLLWLIKSFHVSRYLYISYRRLMSHLKINWWDKLQNSNLAYENIRHVVIFPIYNEGEEIVTPSIQSLQKSQYNLKRIWGVIAIEERGGPEGVEMAYRLKEKFESHFEKLFVVVHPDNLPDEAKAKGANITYAAQQIEKELEKENLTFDQVLVTSLDADSSLHPQLLAHFTYTFLTTENRQKRLFQFIPMYHNNFWDAPGFSRIIAISAGFWTMIESTREDRFRVFATYGMSWRNLKDAEYWDKKSIIEDGIQYWRNIFAQKNEVGYVVPVYAIVYMDAVFGGSFWATLKAQYKQLRRWSWGASDLAFIAPRFSRMKDFSLKDKYLYISRLVVNHLTWSTVPLFLLFAGQIPLINHTFSQTILGSNLPLYTSVILTISLLGLSLAIIISALLLPDNPNKRNVWWQIKHILPWILAPLVTIIYGAIPALHSQTELMLGKKMEKFTVTIKMRNKTSS